MRATAGKSKRVNAWLLAMVALSPSGLAQVGDDPGDPAAWLGLYSELFEDALPLQVRADATITIWIREGDTAKPLASSRGYYRAVFDQERRRVESKIMPDPPGGPSPSYSIRTVFDGTRHTIEDGETGAVHVGTQAGPTAVGLPPSPLLMGVVPFLPPDLVAMQSGQSLSTNRGLSEDVLGLLGSALVFTSADGHDMTYTQRDSPGQRVLVQLIEVGGRLAPSMLTQLDNGIEVARLMLEEWKRSESGGRRVFFPHRVTLMSLDTEGHPELTFEYEIQELRLLESVPSAAFVLDTDFGSVLIDHDSGAVIGPDPTLPPTKLPEPLKAETSSGGSFTLFAVPLAVLLVLGGIVLVRARGKGTG